MDYTCVIHPLISQLSLSISIYLSLSLALALALDLSVERYRHRLLSGMVFAGSSGHQIGMRNKSRLIPGLPVKRVGAPRPKCLNSRCRHRPLRPLASSEPRLAPGCHKPVEAPSFGSMGSSVARGLDTRCRHRRFRSMGRGAPRRSTGRLCVER